MKRLSYIGIAFFNFIFGCLFVFVAAPWIMAYIYVAEAVGWIIDPTLDEGLFLVFLFIAIAISSIYFPLLIFVNNYFNKKIKMRKRNFNILISIIFIVGIFSTCLILYLN